MDKKRCQKRHTHVMEYGYLVDHNDGSTPIVYGWLPELGSISGSVTIRRVHILVEK